MKKKFYIILLVLVLPCTVYSQVSHDSLSFIIKNFQIRNLSSNFQKQLNTYKLNSAFRYGIEVDKIFIGIREQFNSTVVKSVQNTIKDEQYFSLFSEYDLAPIIKLGTLINYNFYSDDRKLDINNTSNFNSSLFTKINIRDNIKLIPFGGISNNKQIGEEDYGFIYGTEGLYDYTKPNDFNFSSKLKFQNEDISPRKNTLRYFIANITNAFENSFFNKITAKYSQQRKDFYFLADSLTSTKFHVDNNIQSRIESNYFLQDRLLFASRTSNLSLDLLGRVSWRNIQRNTRYLFFENLSSSNLSSFPFSTKIEEFILNFSALAEYKTKIFSSRIKLAFSEREEKHMLKSEPDANSILFNDRDDIEKRKNNNSQQIVLSASFGYKFSSKDQVLFSAFHRKLRYDTPSEDNFDDRDELLSIFRISYLRKFSPFFNMFINFEGSINHIVYIFAKRSSNNNIKRILKLNTGGNYKNKYLTSRNTIEILANYTVFDFEDLNPNFKSFSFRQFAAKDSTGLRLNKRVHLVASGYVKLSEQGDFKWTSFSNKPKRFLAEYNIEPMMIYKHLNMSFGVGIRYFSIATFKYNDKIIKIKETEYTSIGPTTEITLSFENQLYLKLYGWYEFITTEKKIKREQANLNLQVNWNI